MVNLCGLRNQCYRWRKWYHNNQRYSKCYYHSKLKLIMNETKPESNFKMECNFKILIKSIQSLSIELSSLI